MKHPKIDFEKLSKRLRNSVGNTPVSDLAKSAKIHPSRVTRFLNGDFKKMTPVLREFCKAVGVSPDEFLLDDPTSTCPQEIFRSIQRIVGHDAKKIKAATHLMRNLEALTINKSA